VISAIFGSIAVAVIDFAVVQSVTIATSAAWAQLGELVTSNLNYFAFDVDLILLAIFQPMILARLVNHNNNNRLPYARKGVVLWLCFVNYDL
jgi:hypothetical protein